jgi:hypothetical protein
VIIPNIHLGDANALHIVPRNDLREHGASSECWCKPIQDEDWPIWIHNSADRREHTIEQGKVQ